MMKKLLILLIASMMCWVPLISPTTAEARGGHGGGGFHGGFHGGGFHGRGFHGGFRGGPRFFGGVGFFWPWGWYYPGYYSYYPPPPPTYYAVPQTVQPPYTTPYPGYFDPPPADYLNPRPDTPATPPIMRNNPLGSG